MRTLPASLLTLALVGSLAASARAEVDVEVPINCKVKGTLSAPGEADVYRVFAARGTAFTLTAAPKGKAVLDLAVELQDANGDPAILDQGGSLVTDGGKVSWKAFTFASTGRYRIVVSGEGTGDYSFSLKGKPRALWTDAATMGAAPSYGATTFAAYPGGSATILVKAAGGSAAVPRLQTLYDVSETYSVDLSAVGTTGPTSHVAVVTGLQPNGNELVQDFQNVGAAGDVEVVVKVKPPKGKPGKFDLRGVALGMPGGGETFVGRTLDGDGGTVEAEDESGDLYGASVTFPSDALAGPTLVTLASTPPPPIGDPDDQAAGPAVDFGPSGVVFAAPAVITLPIDPSLIPADADITDVRILIVEDNGTSRIEVPTGFNAGSVTVETTGFSVCCPIVQSGPPPLGLAPGGDEFWYMEFHAEMYDGPQDNRQRAIAVTLGELSFYGDGTLQASGERRDFSWQNQDAPGGSGLPISAGLAESSQPDNASLNWAYDASGRRIVLSGSPESLPTFRISRDGRYIAGRHDGSVEPDAQALFAVRKNTAAITAASIQGTWTCVYLESDAGNDSSTGAAYAKVTRGTGTFQFDGTTGCRVSFTQRRPRFVPSSQTFVHETESATVADATYAIDVDGTVLVTLPGLAEGGGDSVLRARPGAGLDVMLANHDAFGNNAHQGMVLVRQGSGLSKASLAGDYHGADWSLDPQSYVTPLPGSSVPIGDFSCRDEGVLGVFDGGATASFTFDIHAVSRDPDVPAGFHQENYVDPAVVGVSLTSTGKLFLDGGEGKIVGQASRDGQFFAGVTDVANADQEYAIFIAFRAPPDKTP